MVFYLVFLLKLFFKALFAYCTLYAGMDFSMMFIQGVLINWGFTLGARHYPPIAVKNMEIKVDINVTATLKKYEKIRRKTINNLKH